MAQASFPLIRALRQAAGRLKSGSHYAWGHHGACNCGHLLQVVTDLSEAEILSYAHTGNGEWTEIAEESCSVTGVPAGLMVSKLEQLGLTTTDIHNIEYLEDREVLKRLPGGFRWLKRNLREDVIVYFEAYASLLEEQLLFYTRIGFDKFLDDLSMSSRQEQVSHGSKNLSVPVV